MDEVQELLESIEKINFQLHQKIKTHCKSVHLKKGDYLFRNGDNHFYFDIITKGLLRIFYLNEDKEANLWFNFEGDPIFSLSGYSFRKPALENVQAIEDCTLDRIHLDKLKELLESDIELSNLMIQLSHHFMFLLELRMYHQMNSSATERYKLLLKWFPGLVNRVSLGLIASYLGINQVSLSRIRAKKS